VKRLSFLFCLFVIFGLLLTTTAQAQDTSSGIEVEDAWIRAMPPTGKTTAAFMVIENSTAHEMILKSAACDVADMVQIHTMEQDGEIIKMKEIPELSIPANGKRMLAPKGYHIMLIGLLRPIKENETIPITLDFADGSSVVVGAVVRKWEPMGGGMMHGKHGS